VAAVAVRSVCIESRHPPLTEIQRRVPSRPQATSQPRRLWRSSLQ